jgi:hypothetical protein
MFPTTMPWPMTQSEAKEEEAMIRGLWVLVVTVVWGVVRAGFVCAVRPCCFVRLTCISAPKNQQTTIAGKLSMRQTKLLHLIKANL